MRLLLVVPCVGLQSVIVAFTIHTNLHFRLVLIGSLLEYNDIIWDMNELLTSTCNIKK